MKTTEIEQAFLETNYIIHLQGKIVLRIGEMPADLLKQLPSLETWAFITAWNPLPDILSKAENDVRNAALQRHLIDHGYTVHNGIGISKDQSWSEESFFMEDARQVSAKFGQLAFVYGDRKNGNQLVFT